MPPRKFDSPRGILDFASGEKQFHFSRYHPSEELSFFIEHYWIVEWDLRDQPNHQQESLPHPSIHIIVESDRSEVVGVVEGKYTRMLKGSGWVFGIKFWPGGFYPFFNAPVCDLTNHIVPLSKVFGGGSTVFGKIVPVSPIGELQVKLAEEWLRARHPVRDQNIELIRKIVDQIATDASITKVDDLLATVEMSKRTLQRLFSRYVGVSAKWIIQRYRLHEAIEKIDHTRPIDWANLALDLGYYDQAHFIKHFKKFVGRSPDEYARGQENKASD